MLFKSDFNIINKNDFKLMDIESFLKVLIYIYMYMYIPSANHVTLSKPQK